MIPRSAYVRRFLHNRGWHRFCRVSTREVPNPWHYPLTYDGRELDVTYLNDTGPTRTVTYHR